MYDAIVRVPLMVWSPDLFKGNRKVNGLMQSMDMGAAILEIAGVTVPSSFEAKSILPVLKGEEWFGRPYVFAEQVKDGIYTDGPFMTMVRNHEWKLVHFLDADYGQLFNLQNDPEEMHNLWDVSDQIATKRELLDVLREWHIRSQVHTANWAEDWR